MSNGGHGETRWVRHLPTPHQLPASDLLELFKQMQAEDPPLPILHVGRVALSAWHPAEPLLPHDAVDILIREGDVTRFRDRMTAARYQLVYEDLHDREARLADGLLTTPGNPGPTFAHTTEYPFGLLTRFYTNWRHSHLALVDLISWFNWAEPVDPPESEALGLMRPPLWALLIWYACCASGDAADGSISKQKLAEVQLVASHLTRPDWDEVVRKAPAYDREYLTRVNRCPADGMVRAYAASRPESDERKAALDAAEREYGCCCEMRQILEAIVSYPEWENSVPPDVLAAVRGGTGQAPRKFWEFAGVVRGDPVAPEESTGFLGRAVGSFTVREQIDTFAPNPRLVYADLENDDKVVTLTSHALTRGPWHECTLDDLQDIFRPL